MKKTCKAMSLIPIFVLFVGNVQFMILIIDYTIIGNFQTCMTILVCVWRMNVYKKLLIKINFDSW